MIKLCSNGFRNFSIRKMTLRKNMLTIIRLALQKRGFLILRYYATTKSHHEL